MHCSTKIPKQNKNRTPGLFKISKPYGPKHKWKYSEHILSQRHIKWNSSSRSEPAYINALQVKDFNYRFSRAFNIENNEQHIVIIVVKNIINLQNCVFCILWRIECNIHNNLVKSRWFWAISTVFLQMVFGTLKRSAEIV